MEAFLGPFIPLTYVLMLVVERLWPAKPLPKVRFWLLKGFLGFAFLAAVSGVLPALIATLANGRTPFHLAGLGTVPGAILAALLSDLLAYWLHRTMHRIPFVWRWSHQLHHSAERMDLAGLAYQHPFDSLVTFALTTVLVFVLGLSPDAAALGGFLGFLASVFCHMNVRTPAWLGYVVSRPEQHALHHARDVHAYNYASFPVWDLAFRTFRNPASGEFPTHYGFWDGASARLGSMLLGRDVGRMS